MVSRTSKIICDWSFNLIGQFPYNGNFDFITEKISDASLSRPSRRPRLIRSRSPWSCATCCSGNDYINSCIWPKANLKQKIKPLLRPIWTTDHFEFCIKKLVIPCISGQNNLKTQERSDLKLAQKMYIYYMFSPFGRVSRLFLFIMLD